MNIIDGANAEFSNTRSRIERVAKVTGVTGDGDAKLINACSTIGMPTIGSSYPNFAPLKLVRMLPKAIDSDTIEVRLIYESATIPQNTINVVGTLSQGQTNTDINGNGIDVSYIYPANWELYPEFAGSTQPKNLFAPILKPGASVTVTKTKTYIPWTHILDYTGKVNSGSFKMAGSRLRGDRKWLCSVTASSSDAGVTYGITYSFQYNSDTWDAKAVYTDPHFGGPPPGVEDPVAQPNGTLWYQIYETANFNNLAL